MEHSAFRLNSVKYSPCARVAGMVGLPIQQPPYSTEDVYNWIEQLWSRKQEWPEYTQALRSALCPADSGPSHQPPFLLLPGLCCQAAGGNPEHSIGIAAAWTLLYTAAHILDDLEDGDVASGAAPAINVTTGLIFTAIRALAVLRHSEVADRTRLAVIKEFAHAALQMCGSQHADLVGSLPSLEQCWKVTAAKSGVWFALACRAGARMSNATDESIDHYSQFGHHLGVLVQISDDLRGVWSSVETRSDLAAGKRTLPVVYALMVTPPDTRARLLEYLRAAPCDPTAEAAARQLLEQVGAPLYLAVEAQRYFRRAKTALHAAAPSSPPRDQLIDLLSKLVPSQQQL